MYYFIVNPNSRSGSGLRIWHRLRAELEGRKIDYQVYMTECVGHGKKLAEQISSLASAENPIHLIGMGGDGTITEILTGLRNIEYITFGFIPTGSGNDFCRGMKLPTDPLKALDSILKEERIMNMDIPRVDCNNRFYRFGISTGLGFDAAICHEVAISKLKKAFNKIGLGKLIYVLIALKQLLFCTPFSLSMKLDGETEYHYKKVYFAAIMNQQYEGGGFKFCPDAKPDDGVLDILVAEGLPRLVIVLALPTAFFGKHTIFKGIHIHRAKDIEFHSDTAAALHKDGEVGGFAKDISVCMEKNTLKVIMPVL